MITVYRPEIDGLRAISILSVLLFHLKVPGFGGGYVGVDIFFVISGYLITRILVSDLEAGRFSYYRFYARRIRRLFPAFYFTILISLVAAILLLSPEDLREFAGTVIAAFIAVTNFMFWRQSHAYFISDVDYLPLLHTWSLSVEEQFYLFCPAALILAAHFGLIRKAAIGFAIAGLISLLACQAWLQRDPSAVFYLPQFRVFEFAIGALCIDAEKRRVTSALALQIIEISGLAMIGISISIFTKNTPFPGFAALLPCVGAAFVIYAGEVPGVGRVLTNRLAVGVGLISYSLYLCHWPIIVFTRYAIGEVVSLHGKLFLAAAAAVTAIGMYQFIEKPFRVSPATPVTLPRFGKLVAVCAMLAALQVLPAALADHQAGWPWRLSEAQRELREKHRYPTAACIEDGTSQCAFGDLKAPLGVQLIGDSYMEHLIPAFVPLAQQLHLRGEALVLGGCPMLLGLQALMANGDVNSDCQRFRDRTFSQIQKNDVPVVISQRWKSTALADDTGKSMANQTEDVRAEAWHQAIERTIVALGYKRKYLIIGSQVQQSCIVGRDHFYIGPFSATNLDGICDALPAATARSDNATMNEMLRTIQRAHSENVTLLFPEDYICGSDRCIFAWSGRLLYHDSSHFTVAGAEYIGARASQALQDFFRSDAKETAPANGARGATP